MTDLRPCPFCGGEVSITYISADNVFSIWHKYDGCKFIEPMYIDGKDAKSLSDARNIWNERSVPYLMKEQEAVKPRVSTVEQRCGNCNKVIEMDGWIACPWCGKPIRWEAVGRSVK